MDLLVEGDGGGFRSLTGGFLREFSTEKELMIQWRSPSCIRAHFVTLDVSHMIFVTKPNRAFANVYVFKRSMKRF